MNNNGKKEFLYKITMLNGETAQISIFSANETEKKVYLKHFLEISRDQDVYFLDKLTQKLYNKNHVISCEEILEN